MRLLTVPCGASHTVQIKKKPKETGTAASFSSSSSTVVLSSNNDGSFDALWDPSISKASDFESSYISAKRLKPESSNRQKKKKILINILGRKTPTR